MDKEKLKIERLLPPANLSDNAQLALREFAASVVKENTINVQNSGNYIRYSFWSLYVMYRPFFRVCILSN